MERLPEPKSEALRALYWRDEILQLMFWIKGEGFGDEVDPALLERFLGVDAQAGLSYLDRLVDEGLLRRSPHVRYQLTEKGHEVGERVFTAEFAELTKPAHGECSASCWCRQSPDEAEACTERRLTGHHAEH
jgi:DNA-binding MarR family transcriptional regulator